jgi:hypothetical protein
MCAALKGRTHGCTDQGSCKREESPFQLGAVHTWHKPDTGIGVSQRALENAFANPNAVQYAPSAYGATFRFVGNDATVVVKPQGNVVTGWATSTTLALFV